MSEADRFMELRVLEEQATAHYITSFQYIYQHFLHRADLKNITSNQVLKN